MMRIKEAMEKSAKAPHLSDLQMAALEIRVVLMKRAMKNDELHFHMKNEFWNGWNNYWGPTLACRIIRGDGFSEIKIMDAGDTSKIWKIIQCD